MRVESEAELMSFFSPDEFGEEATLRTGTGDHPVTGHPDTMAETAKPGGVQNSSRGAFTTGAADFTVQELQFMTDSGRVAASGAKREDTLIIQAGRYAGQYRIKDIQSDGAVCRLLLNKR